MVVGWMEGPLIPLSGMQAFGFPLGLVIAIRASQAPEQRWRDLGGDGTSVTPLVSGVQSPRRRGVDNVGTRCELFVLLHP